MKRSDTRRITVFLVIVAILLGGLTYRFFVLMRIRYPSYVLTAQTQTEHLASIFTRGTIYLADKTDTDTAAAANKKFPVLSIRSGGLDQTQRTQTVEKLAAITGISAETIENALTAANRSTRTLSRHLTPEQVQQVEALGLKDISIGYETDRFYPNGTLAADVLGFLGYAGSVRSGQYGVESYYDRELFGKGTAANAIAAANVFTRFLGLGTVAKETVDRPQDLVLTIDRTVQVFIEQQLEATVKKWSASGGSIIVQDPRSGAILAMADRPVFDPNAYSESEPELYLNGSVQQIFEPGSSFKPITMAAGLDAGTITPTTTYEDTGSVTIAGHTIRNFDGKAHGIKTMTQVLEKSLNTGSMFVENRLGDDVFLSYVVNMGFGQRTNIDLPGEVNGDISNLYSGRKINFLTASFGQGVAVTPLQLITAYSAIANGGKLMRPYVVDKVVQEGGAEIVTEHKIAGIPIKERTAALLRGMLVSVVDNGFDKARIPGYDIAGKTGTAQVPDVAGGYTEGQYIHTFVGFAPASDARFVVLIKLDRPQGITFASDSLSPVFRDIMAFLLNYYSIPPTRQ